MIQLLEQRRTSFAALALLALVAACGGAPDSEPAAETVEEAAAAAGGGAASETEEGGHYLGEPRDDIDRFFGLYGEEGGRQFFVTEAKRPAYAERAPEIPPGYLAIGAMWGDVAPMHLKSLADNRFEEVDRSDFAAEEPSVAEFEIGPDGDAVALTFTSGIFSDYGRLERAGDLPEKFQ